MNFTKKGGVSFSQKIHRWSFDQKVLAVLIVGWSAEMTFNFIDGRNYAISYQAIQISAYFNQRRKSGKQLYQEVWKLHILVSPPFLSFSRRKRRSSCFDKILPKSWFLVACFSIKRVSCLTESSSLVRVRLTFTTTLIAAKNDDKMVKKPTAVSHVIGDHPPCKVNI